MSTETKKEIKAGDTVRVRFGSGVKDCIVRSVGITGCTLWCSALGEFTYSKDPRCFEIINEPPQP